MTASRLDALTRRSPLWLSGRLAALGLGRRRLDVLRPAAIIGRGAPAGGLGPPASVVHAALPQRRARGQGCIAVTQPYQGEARFTIALISRAALRQLLDE